MKKSKFRIQERQYVFPYHYLVDFDKYSKNKSLFWGIEYYSYIKRTIDYIKKSDPRNVLDVGCGDGRLLNELSRIKDKVKFVGIDKSKVAINLAKALNPNKLNLSFKNEDIANLNEKFDLVILNEVIEHISNEDEHEFINNVAKVLNKNGEIIVTVPSTNVPLNKKHYRHYTIADLCSRFNDFKLINEEYIFKYGLLLKYFMIFFNFLNLEKLELLIAEKFIFKANKNNGSHILAVFKK